MSDIYENHQQVPHKANPRPKRRRRSSGNRVFDETGERKRRTRNSGFRRFLHLIRKDENEGRFWWGVLIAALVLLFIVSIWQFWYVDHVARERSKQNEVYTPIPQSWTESATK